MFAINRRLTWNRKAYRLRESAIQFVFRTPSLFSVPSKGIIHPSTYRPTYPCPESKHATQICQIAGKG